MRIGYIFDLDGVITDTAEYHYLSWKRVADEEGLPFTRADNEHLRGVTRRRSLEILLKGKVYPEAEMQAMMARKNVYFYEHLRMFTADNLLPGVGQLLREAKDAGIKLGVASASRNARPICERLGIFDLFDGFGDATTVPNPKPAPDVFLWVAGRMNVHPAQCVVFEDAASGVETALAAGFLTCGLGPVERVGAANWVRDDLHGARVADFPLE